jgi:hypothetical protein
MSLKPEVESVILTPVEAVAEAERNLIAILRVDPMFISEEGFRNLLPMTI